MVLRSSAAIVALILIVIVGCSDDKSTFQVVDPPADPVALEPDSLIAHLVRAYAEREFAQYDRLLHEDFVFEFAPEDEMLSPSLQGWWGRDDETGSTFGIFTGAEGRRPDDSIIPGVASLRIHLIPVEPSWIDGSVEGPGFQGTLMRRYDVDITVSHEEGDLVGEVIGIQRFFVKPSPRLLDGEEVDVYELVWWEDQGRSHGRSGVSARRAATEPISWGVLKARFLPGPDPTRG